jgi:cyclophilin family peptidyl-prolyl cis-trans isomerase
LRALGFQRILGQGVLDPRAEEVKLTPMIAFLQRGAWRLVLGSLMLVGCSPGGEGGSVRGHADGVGADRFAEGMGVADSDLGEYWVEFACSADGVPLGTLAFELFAKEAPGSTRAFLRLVDLGTYDGTLINRVEREFLLQGGGDTLRPDPLGIRGLVGAQGMTREHHYGILGWAAPAAREFIICLAESPRVWALDHQGQLPLGHLISGVEVLEGLANVETRHGADNQRSVPVSALRVDSARALKGEAPRGEVIVRPRPDLQGAPERVGVRHIRISFRGRGRGQERGVTRTREEAELLAQGVLTRIQSGEISFSDAARRWSEDPPLPTTGEPVLRRISNFGVVDVPAQRARQDAPRMLNTYIGELALRLRSGELSREDLLRMQELKAIEIGEWIQATALERREEVNSPAYTEVAFALRVGEVGLVVFDRFRCPDGWYLVERLE